MLPLHHSAKSAIAWVLGLILTFAGILGFLTEGNLLGLEVNTLHNLFHLGSGIIGIVAAFDREKFTEAFLLTLGIAYLILALDGFVWDGMLFSLFPMNVADNYLHMAVAALALAVIAPELAQVHGRRRFLGR